MEEALGGAIEAFGLVVPALEVEAAGDDCWRLAGPGGAFALRAIRSRAPTARFCLAALEHLIGRGCRLIPAFERVPGGGLGVRLGHATWILARWVEGRGALLGLEEDALPAARSLGLLHLDARGLISPTRDGAAEPAAAADEAGEPERLGRLRQRLGALRIYRLMAQNRLRRTAADGAYLSALEAALPAAERAVAGLHDSPLAKLEEDAAREGAFAYRRISEGGIVLAGAEPGGAVFTDWSGCRPRPQLFDIFRLMARVIGGSGGDAALAGRTLRAYAGARALGDAERAVLPLLLEFPDHVYTVARRFYENERDWSVRSFLGRLGRAQQADHNRRAAAGAVRAALGED